MLDIPPNIFPHFKEQDIDFLNKPVLNDEIKKALFDMAPLKTPGSDGIEGELNNSLIVLIPKKDRPEDFSQFWPISLCSIMYKLVMKVIANRFKVVFSNYSSPEQAGFIAGRNISDNVIIAQEVIHSMRSKKAGRKWMAIKLDLEKAYDRSFKPVRGIRQGYPLSPYLFVLCMEWLGHLIRSKMSTGRWTPIRLSRSGPSLSHLFFTDDLVIFSKAEMGQALLLKEILRRFCNFSGHKISERKSSMFFSKSVDSSLGDQISQFFVFQKVLNLGTYLGVPLLHDRVTKSTLEFVIEKVRGKLQNWEARKLSFAGRVTLAQLVLLAIPSYSMQSLAIPKGVCDEIEKIARQFIWGVQLIIQNLPWLGGIPFVSRGTAMDLDLDIFMTIIISRKDALWVRVLRSKYGWKDHLPASIQRSHCSHLWKSLSKVWPLVYENLMWSVGDGTTIRGWVDSWVLDVGPLLSHVPAHGSLNMDSILKDWVMQYGSWNVDMLRIWLSDDIIQRIISIPPPHPAGGEDRIIWARSGVGSFSVRSAYWALKENSWRTKDNI
ncbi:LINE-1 reverse transcriptase isogeny [Gossypium australe]|uniref:LINE-1 reverse transcriptase isogeny n=1 Tax=Gossypium australe TaxID=47621 RepID=A0A5B6WEV9_9ROSI|nr:LINE-1 reverse transcriptase isogeny [Gossypium australe]